jgi:hypothetical protein
MVIGEIEVSALSGFNEIVSYLALGNPPGDSGGGANCCTARRKTGDAGGGHLPMISTIPSATGRPAKRLWRRSKSWRRSTARGRSTSSLDHNAAAQPRPAFQYKPARTRRPQRASCEAEMGAVDSQSEASAAEQARRSAPRPRCRELAVAGARCEPGPRCLVCPVGRCAVAVGPASAGRPCRSPG